ncbi:MAG: hypothetical protein IK073_05570 [Paludibacteraceae bacterium]|nr:hypothetical protein [Paludibacteraceae bacterium]
MFYATAAGTYKVKANIKAETNCHIASNQSGELTITVNRLNSTTTFSNETINVTTDTNSKVYATLPEKDDNRTITYGVTNASGTWASTDDAHVEGNKFYATAAGVYTITATADANTRYKAINSSFTVTVNRVNQTLSWDNESAIDENLNIKKGKTYDIKATASSGLNVTYTTANASYLKVNNGENATTSNGCTLSAVEATGDNTITITASQPGNKQYNAATSITKSFKVLDKQTPALYPSDSWTTSASKTSLKVGEQVALRVDKVSAGLGTSNASNFYYTVSPADALRASRDGNNVTITAYSEAADATITFYQSGDDDIFDKTWSYNFGVSKNEPTISVPGNQTLDVDGEYTAELSYTNVSASVPAEGEEGNDFYYTISQSQTTSVNKNDQVITFNPSTGEIVAQNAGTATITITQKATREYSTESASFTITVNKINNTLARTVDKHEMFVDEYIEHLIGNSVAVANRNNSDVPVTVTTEDEDLIRYDADNDKLIVPNDANEMFGASKTVNVIFSQPETYKYTAANETIAVNVKKHATSIAPAADYSKQVEQTQQIANYNPQYVTADQPTLGATNHEFYYTIEHTLPTNAVVAGSAHPTEVIGYDPSTHTITAYNAGSAVLKIAQKQTYNYTGDTVTYNVTVTKYATSFTGSAYNLMVDATQEANYTYSNVDGTPTANNSDNFYYTIDDITYTNAAKNNGTGVVTFNPNDKTISAKNAGTCKITLHQTETYKYTGATQSFNVAVFKYNSTFANVDDKSVKVDSDVSSSYTLKYTKPTSPASIIGDDNLASLTPVLGVHATNFYYTLTQNVTTKVTTGSPDVSLAITYNAETKTATGKNAGTGTIHLYQPETYKYNAADEDFVVTVTKYANWFKYSWKSSANKTTDWSETMNLEDNAAFTYSTENTITTPTINQTEGNTAGNVVATYTPAQNKITTTYNTGDAEWTLHQDENYKYEKADATLTVKVETENCQTCYAYKLDPNKKASEVGEKTWTEVGVADGLTFQMKVNGLGNNVKVSTCESGKEYGETVEYSEWSDSYQTKVVDISEKPNTIKVKFEKSGNIGTDNPYINTIRVSRKKWFKLTNTSGTEIDTLPNMTNTLGGTPTTKTFKVNYSTCDSKIKIVSNNEHVLISTPKSTTPAQSKQLTLPTVSTRDGGSGDSLITVTYTATKPESIDAIITVYTKYENKTLRIHAEVEKKNQTITWGTAYSAATLTLQQGLVDSLAATASSNLPITYRSGNENIIKISADSLSFEVIGTGNTTLTAVQKGDSEFKSVTSTKSVIASNKKSQIITWNQNLTRGISPEQVIPLTAKAIVVDIVNKTQGVSNERSALIQYECLHGASDTVAQIFTDPTKGLCVRILDYGETTITASLAGNEDYMEAIPVTIAVNVPRPQNGKCTMDTLNWSSSGVVNGSQEIEYFAFDTDMPEITKIFAIDRTNGDPGYLSFYMRSVAYGLIQAWKGTFDIYQSTDNGGTYTKIESKSGFQPAKNDKMPVNNVPLDRNATHFKIVRRQGGVGYHYLGDIVIDRAVYIETENTDIDLGNIAVGESREQTIAINYSSVKGNMSVSKQYSDNGLTTDETIYADCGAKDSYELPITVAPSSVGSWSNRITIMDEHNTGLSLIINLTATATQGSQAIIWNPTKTTFYTVQATELEAQLTKKSNRDLNVTYSSSDNSIVSFSGSTPTISGNGNVTIYADCGATSDYKAAEQVSHDFIINRTPTTIVTAPTLPTIYGGTSAASVVLNTASAAAKETIKNNAVQGTYAITSPATLDAGTYDVTITFTPSNTAMYAPSTVTIQNVTVEQRAATNEEIGTLTATHVTYGQKLSDAQLTLSGSLNGQGTFTWTDARKDNKENAGTYTALTVTFTPTNTNIAPKEFLVDVTVEKVTPTLSWTAQPSNVTYGETATYTASSTSQESSISYSISEGAEYASIDAIGLLTVIEAGHTVTVQALQEASTNYNAASITTTVTLNKATTTGYSATASSISVGQQVSNSSITNTGIDGTWAWVNPNATYSEPNTYSVAATFTPADPNYESVQTTLSLTVTPPTYTYTGNGDWTNDDNWSTHEAPTEPQNVVINGNVTINTEVEVNSLTIEQGAQVTLTVNGQLTVGSGNSEYRENYGDLHVENEGHVILGSGELKVNDFILDASLADIVESQCATSGQVTNPASLDVTGAAYFDLAFDPDGQVTFGWYDFTVPFEVNISNGIYRLNDDGSTTPMRSGSEFLIYRYDEAKRATGTKGWVNAGAVLNAGEAYTITLDYEMVKNVVRFVWNGNNSLGASYNCAVTRSETGDDSNRGWNGLGNGTLTHTELQSLPAQTKVQMYDHGTKAYKPVEAAQYTYAVGTAFFYQVPNTDDVILSPAEKSLPMRAPQREVRTVDEFRLSLKTADTEREQDVMWVSASEDATTEYTVGHDLLKMTSLSDTKIAQMWVACGGLMLCDAEMPLTNNNASFPLEFYAPQAGSYSVAIERSPEDATLFLTYDGRIIWNLSMSEYPLELQKGTTQGYGLRLVADRQTTTDFEQTEATIQGVKKVLIDNQLYLIMPDGAIYTAEGKKVNE